MASTIGFSGDFPLDTSISTTAKLTLAASADASATEAILSNSKFPDGAIQLGRISLTTDSGKVKVNQASVDGASVSFDIAASAQRGHGVYLKFAGARTI